jgi:threonyl-tRNA synthetase
VAAQLDASGYRVEVDHRSEKLGYKIREAQKNKIPYMVIVGDKDVENNTVSIRHRSGADLGAMTFQEFSTLLQSEVDSKEIK